MSGDLSYSHGLMVNHDVMVARKDKHNLQQQAHDKLLNGFIQHKQTQSHSLLPKKKTEI